MDERQRATTGTTGMDETDMTGTTGTTGATGTGAQGAQTGQSDTEAAAVTRELQELGRQLAATARAAWQSPRRQELQQDITEGMRSLRDQLTDTIDTVRGNPRAQNVTQTVKENVGKVAETTRASDLVDDVRTGLASGLRELNDQLRRLSDRLERQEGDAAAAGTSATTATGASETSTPVGTPSVTDTAHAVQVAPPAVVPQSASQGMGTTPGTGAVATPEMATGVPSGLPSAPEGPDGPVGMDDKERRGEIPTA